MTARRARVLVAGAVVVALGLVGGCSTSQERLDTARTDYTTVIEIANDLTDIAQTLDPTLELNYSAQDDTWSVCAQHNPNAPPTSTKWQAARGLAATYKGTTELIEPLIQDYLAAGWTRNPTEFNPAVDTEQALLKDGINIIITGSLPTDTSNLTSHLRFWVRSDCTTPPDDLDSFDPEYPENFFPNATLPTQPPNTRPTLNSWEVY